MIYPVQVDADHGLYQDARNVRLFLGLGREEFARLGGLTEETVSHWEEGKTIEGSLRGRAEELSGLLKSLTDVMRAESVAGWLSRPNQAFDGLKPSEVIERGDYDRIRLKIYQLQSGIPT